MTTDHQERARVRSRIGSVVLEFCRRNIYDPISYTPTFHMEDLTRYVQGKIKTAPDSPRRILWELQREGYVGYEVVSRGKSLYKVKWVRERPAEQAELFARVQA